MRPQPMRRGQQRRLDDGRHPDLHLGHAEEAFGGDAHVAGGSHFKAGPERVAFQTADHGNGAVADRLAEFMDQRDEGAPFLALAERGHMVDVGAADESLAADAREDHHTQIFVLGKRMKRVGQITQRRWVEHVQSPGIVVHDMDDGSMLALLAPDFDLVRDRRRHGFAPWLFVDCVEFF